MFSCPSAFSSKTRGQSSSTKSSVSFGASKMDKPHTAVAKGVIISRVVFVATLMLMSALLGYGSYIILSQSEEKLATEQFNAIADRALVNSQEIAARKKNGIVTLTVMMEQTYPNAETWPNIPRNGFEVISNQLITTASGDTMSLLPLVTPDQLNSFQQFAAPMYPETGVTRVFGLDQTFQKYNETDGETYWNSPNKIFTPFLHSSRGPILFMANYHSQESRGREIDRVIACANERALNIQQNGNQDNFTRIQCSFVSEMVDLSFRSGQDFNPSSVLIRPIFPENNQSVLVGFITSTIKWHDTLVNVFDSEVVGVDCVLQTDTQVFTYQISHGEIVLKGEGDFHSHKYSKHGQSVVLNPPGLYSDSSPIYTLSVYPSKRFFAVYETNNPTIATVGAVCIVILTAILFFLYDFFVRREFNHKDALDKARRQFVRFVSHEVRTPLNSVCMGLQLQQDEATTFLKKVDDPNTSVQQEQLRKNMTEFSSLSSDIQNNANTAVSVLNDLLNYDKVESGTLHLELTVVPIWDLIEKTFAEFTQQARFNNLRYTLDLTSLGDEEMTISSVLELPREIRKLKVIGDKIRVSQVLRNLISNAIKFSKDGGTITVRVSRIRSNGNGRKQPKDITLHSGEECSCFRSGDIQVEVSDNGSGMEETQLQRLFSEGVQFNVNELQAGQGSGLGLFIAKGLVEKHGGSLKANSEGIGCGTVFTMRIPLYELADPPESKGIDSLTEQTHTVEKMESLNILVVDDTTMNCKLLARLLRNRGHTCTEAEDGAIAVRCVEGALLQGTHYDAILLDYEMPNMDGPTAAKTIREMGVDSFIVGVTGNIFPEDVSHFKACGANLVMGKPLAVQALFDAFMEHGLC